MSLINVSNLTFGYEGSYDLIFDNCSFQIDTEWKLGFIGRNGRGKTTFLSLLMGKYSCGGAISASSAFDYFPFPIGAPDRPALTVIREIIAPFASWESEMESCLAQSSDSALERYGEILEQYTAHDGYIIDELIAREAGKLAVTPDALERPFSQLSNGERTKLMLAALFLKKNHFLLIDEPTNHLDLQGREIVADYLAGKSGFILVSHDRAFLDRCIDHVLSINRNSIEVQRGNYSSWQENKDRQDTFELNENAKLQREITRLQTAAIQKSGWADEIEKSKFGQPIPDRGFIGHKSAKMMKRAKVIENRQQRALDEKTQLLKNLEQADTLKIGQLPFHKERLAEAVDLSIRYGGAPLFEHLNTAILTGDRIALTGKNGCGKSSFIKLLLGDEIPHTGRLAAASGLVISYVPQDTSFLHGSLSAFAQAEGIDESLFKAILRKLDFTRVQFEKEMEQFSGGQKKKVLIARSLSQQAHLYVWDEPLNFIDVLSRIQIEELLLKYQPTMLFVEHDAMFCKKVATRTLPLG